MQETVSILTQSLFFDSGAAACCARRGGIAPRPLPHGRSPVRTVTTQTTRRLASPYPPLEYTTDNGYSFMQKNRSYICISRRNIIALYRRIQCFLHNIFCESVLAFILERKCGSFQEHKGATHSSPCIGIFYGILISHIQYGCGVLFICVRVIPQPSFR